MVVVGVGGGVVVARVVVVRVLLCVSGVCVCVGSVVACVGVWCCWWWCSCAAFWHC